MTRAIILTRGYPASGKSTQALEWVNQDPENRTRCNRDETRYSLFGVYHGLSHRQEGLVTRAQKAAVTALVEAGKAVCVDDTNLRLKYAREWADLAVKLGAQFAVVNVETDADECVRRDKARGEAGGRTVGEDVIRGFAARYPLGRWPEVLPTKKDPAAAWPAYEPAGPSGRDVWLFDLDGTLAHNDGHRGWYGDEELKVGADKTHEHVVRVAGALSSTYQDDEVIFMSGRTERCREQTQDWIRDNLGLHADETNLFMRAAGDQRKDDVVKNEIFERELAGKVNVLGVFDDRPQVVKMWRAKGLPVFDVNARGEEF